MEGPDSVSCEPLTQIKPVSSATSLSVHGECLPRPGGVLAGWEGSRQEQLGEAEVGREDEAVVTRPGLMDQAKVRAGAAQVQRAL